jgi:hypothetical protein
MNAELIRPHASEETLEPQRPLREATSPRAFPDLGPAAGSAAGRELAVVCDGTAGQPFRLSELWQQLRAAEWRLRDAFSERDRWYAVVGAGRFRGESERARCSGMAMLEDVMLGQTSKVVAIDRNLSPSAVAYALRSVLDGMGLRCRLRGVPQLPQARGIGARRGGRPGVEPSAGRIRERFGWRENATRTSGRRDAAARGHLRRLNGAERILPVGLGGERFRCARGERGRG